jgi:hypothetical protein
MPAWVARTSGSARPGTRGAAVVLAGLTVLAAACGDGASPPPSPPASEPATVPARPALGTDLLDVAELRARPGFGMDVRVQPVLGPGDLDVAALTGPCGAPLGLARPTGSGEVRAFRATYTFTVEAIASVADAVAPLERAEADLTSGCTAGPTGSSGAAAPTVTRLALPAVGERRVGWTEQRPGADGSRETRHVALVAAGDRLGVLATVAERPLDPDEFTALVETAFD